MMASALAGSTKAIGERRMRRRSSRNWRASSVVRGRSMAGPWYRLAVLWQRHSGGKPSEASPLAHGARELYRLLPALAIALAALAIVVTLTPALLARGHAVAPAPLASVAASPPG